MKYAAVRRLRRDGVNMSGKTVREYRRNPSRTYERTGREISRLYAKAHRIIDDWQHKTTSMLVHDYDLIGLEDLNLQGMSRKAKAKPDPDRPGAYLHNGQSAKHGLNHALRSAGLAGIVEKLEYKTRLTGQNRLYSSTPRTRRRHAVNAVIATVETAKAKRTSSASNAT